MILFGLRKCCVSKIKSIGAFRDANLSSLALSVANDISTDRISAALSSNEEK